NFVNRTFVLMHKLCGGKVPPLHGEVATAEDQQMIDAFADTKQKVGSLIEQFKFREALSEIMELARKGNKYMQDKEPWILARQLDANGKVEETAQKKIDMCIHVCLQLCANL